MPRRSKRSTNRKRMHSRKIQPADKEFIDANKLMQSMMDIYRNPGIAGPTDYNFGNSAHHPRGPHIHKVGSASHPIPYTCKHEVKSHNSEHGKYTVNITTCTCNGGDCLGSLNRNSMFSNMYGGASIVDDIKTAVTKPKSKKAKSSKSTKEVAAPDAVDDHIEDIVIKDISREVADPKNPGEIIDEPNMIRIPISRSKNTDEPDIKRITLEDAVRTMQGDDIRGKTLKTIKRPVSSSDDIIQPISLDEFKIHPDEMVSDTSKTSKAAAKAEAKAAKDAAKAEAKAVKDAAKAEAKAAKAEAKSKTIKLKPVKKADTPSKSTTARRPRIHMEAIEPPIRRTKTTRRRSPEVAVNMDAPEHPSELEKLLATPDDTIEDTSEPLVPYKPKVHRDMQLMNELVKINVSKLKNKHCRNYGNTDTPYEYNDKVDMSDSKKEPWHESGTYHNVPDSEMPAMYFNVHLGQRKLMLSEVQVLLKYYETKPKAHPIMLYIGAAEGFHLTTLSKMFPGVRFILYDGSLMYKALHKSDKFEVHDGSTPIEPIDKDDPDSVNDGFFTIRKCKRLAKTINSDNLIFISDIRLTETPETFEQGVLRDLRLQEEWMKILKPKLSLVKFRLPWLQEDLTYFTGDIFYGIWPPPASTETRLLIQQKDVIQNNTKVYDFYDYEGLLYYHNKYRRTFCQEWVPKLFEKYIVRQNIYCSCYDCIAELNVLYHYSIIMKKSFDNTITIFGTGLNKDHNLAFQHRKKRKDHPFKKVTTSK